MKLKDKRNETLEVHASPIHSLPEETLANHTPGHEEIRLRAYKIYIEHGGLPGNELDDWLRAERELDPAATAKAGGSWV
jgi:hypothetical protein